MEGASGDGQVKEPCPKQNMLPRTAQLGSEYLQRRRLHNLSGQLVAVLDHPYHKKGVCVC